MQEKQDSVKVRIAIAVIVAVLYVLGAGSYNSSVSAAEHQASATKLVSQAR